MTTVAFPSGFNLQRSSSFENSNNTVVDYLSDGTPRVRVVGSQQYVTIKCDFRFLESSEKDTLESFLKTNRASTITWTIDGVDYSGILLGGHKLEMVGNRFNISFEYYARAV